MSETPGAAGSPPGNASDPPKKKLSPIEMIRAKAAAKAAEPGATAPAAGGEAKPDAPSAPPTGGGAKPMSKLEAIRAAAAAKKTEAGTAETTPKGESPAAKLAEAKEKPAKPIAPKPTQQEPAKAAAGESRRSFIGITISWLFIAWASFIAGCSAAILSTVRFLYPNVLQEPPSVFKIGVPDKFDEGKVYEDWKNDYGVWVIKNEGTLYAIRTVCTHLGCTPNWLEGEQKFKCPCHGSGFSKTGINFEGPAPRPLERYQIALADDGQVQIDKSKKFQQELGQWTEENGAFVKVS